MIGGKAGRHGLRMVALEVMASHVHLFVEAHRSDSLSRIASQFKGFTSRRLRARFPHLRSCLPVVRFRSYLAAVAGALSAESVRRYSGAQDERRWRKERVR
jgi:putative transposase